MKEVWAAIDKGETWHEWWRSVVGTKLITQGAPDGIGKTIRYKWKSFLPLTLSINFKITGRVPYQQIDGISTGDLEGTGVWTFEERNGITYVRYQWEIESTKRLVNFLSPIFHGFFKFAHNVIMKRGEKGLKKRMLSVEF